MAIASIEFGSPSSVPTAPAAGKKLFLGADGRFFEVSPDGTVSPLRTEPTAHTHGISEVNGLQDALDFAISTTYSPNPPSDPAEAARWVHTDTFRAYEFVGGAWIEIVSS